MPQYVVRYGSLRQLGVCSTSRNEQFTRGASVVARTKRGLEAGEVLCDASERAVQDLSDTGSGQILRSLSTEDQRELARLRQQERQIFDFTRKAIADSGLEMTLVDVEHILGGERIVVYYLAENRVDFRELVKVLASEFQTRIEMRQIGVRDEAKLLADYGDCGKPVCCNTHLSEMPPVSMKMAKIQKATLDPTKISGRCGRLKCCLRYEYDTYVEMRKELPKIGSDLVTNKGRATVLAHEILAGQILVQTEDMRRVLIEASDVLTVLPKNNQGSPKKSDTDTTDRGNSEKSKQRKSDSPSTKPSPDAKSNPSSKPSGDNPKGNNPSNESK